MTFTKKEKDLLYQMINFYSMEYKTLKNKFYILENEEDYNKAYKGILNKMDVLKKEILK